jgi:hypothetical protein
LGGDGREVTARAVASDRDAVGVGSQICRVAVRVFERRNRVLNGGGEGALGRPSIFDRQQLVPVFVTGPTVR